MRVVLDTNVLARAAMASGGPAAACLQLLGAPPHTLLVSAYIANELRRVLRYPRLRAHHGRTDAELDALVAEIAADAEHVELQAAVALGAVADDPDDEAVLATAILGQADVLCTLDRDLTRPNVVAYAATFGVRVLSDLELLAELRRALS